MVHSALTSRISRRGVLAALAGAKFTSAAEFYPYGDG
jgi:hypothetical protein